LEASTRTLVRSKHTIIEVSDIYVMIQYVNT